MGLDIKSDPDVTAIPPPVFYPLAGTGLGKTNYFGHRAEDVADAYVCLGSSDGVVLPSWSELEKDQTYWSELERRHQIESGCPLDPVRWNRLERPCP